MWWKGWERRVWRQGRKKWDFWSSHPGVAGSRKAPVPSGRRNLDNSRGLRGPCGQGQHRALSVCESGGCEKRVSGLWTCSIQCHNGASQGRRTVCVCVCELEMWFPLVHGYFVVRWTHWNLKSFLFLLCKWEGLGNVCNGMQALGGFRIYCGYGTKQSIFLFVILSETPCYSKS